MAKILIVVFLGGGTGSLLRHYVQMALYEWIVPYSFPWAMFAVNIARSFPIGLFYALSARPNLSTEARMLLTAGLCGDSTTFSTFSNDGLTLMKQRFYGLFATYTLLGALLGIFATLGEDIVGRTL